MIKLMMCISSLAVLSFMYNSNNILLFLLSIEMMMIVISFSTLNLSQVYFIIILTIGVLEAIVSLSVMMSYCRGQGEDYLYLI